MSIKRDEAERIAEQVWKIIEDSAAYGFNASHSLCVAYDSLYGAYLKSNHPYEYYETILSYYSGEYSKKKKDIKKVGLIKDEMEEHYGILIGGMKFGQDNTSFIADKENKKISRSLLGVKRITIAVAEYLRDYKDEKFKNFHELYMAFQEDKVLNKTHFETLIKIGYFDMFGNRKKLLAYIELVRAFYIKTLRKTSIQKKLDGLVYAKEYITSEVLDNVLKDVAGGITDKSYTKIDPDKLVLGLFELVPDLDFSEEEIIKIEIELMENVNTLVNTPYGEVLATSAKNKSILFKSYKNGKKGWLKVKGKMPNRNDIIIVKKMKKVGKDIILENYVVV
jgi:DNA polymerase III alpha subunit